MRDLERNNDYELMKQAVASTAHIRTVDLEITFPGMPVGYRSKWVHKLLVNYIAEWKEFDVHICDYVALTSLFFKEITTMEVKAERFAINKSDYFEVSLFRYNNEPFVNLRSIHAHIDGQDYDSSDNDLNNEIHNHLREHSNIDHINYISERLNHSKWFNAAYSNEEIDAEISASEIGLVLPDEVGRYIPEQLIQSLLVITPEQYELNDMDNLTYYPVYKFFGYKKSSTSIHCVHFDVLVYILMNRFPRIRADLTRLLTIELEISNVTNQTVEEITRTRLTQLEIENERLRGENTNLLTEIREVRRQNEQVIAQNTNLTNQIMEVRTENNELKETIDELYNMNLSSGVMIRSMDKKLTDVRTAVEEVHNEVSTIRVKDKKLHRTRDVLILYTSPDKPRDNELREHTPDGFTWIGTFNGQPRNFSSSAPRNRIVIFESESNRLDTFKDILEKENIARYIHNRTQYRDILVRNDQIELLFQVITEELNRDDTFESVTNLEEALTTNNVNDAEIRLKQQLLQQYSPLLINLNRYKRRLYANVNDELVLVEDAQNPENYEWMYRYGPNGSKFGKLDLDVLRTSRFTNELETRIGYE